MSSTPILENIGKYFRISPDYGGCLGYYSADNCCYGCDDDTLELEGYEDTPFIVPGLEDWCNEWEIHCYNSVHKLPSRPEADTWDERGLDLAQRLRQIMPDDVALLFSKGDKDVLIDRITYFYLSADTCFAIGDTNQYTVTYEGDYLQIADFLPIHLPGLDKWWHEFDAHVDYADTCADADFDWLTWCLKGIHFASIIRKAIPDSVQIWFRTPFELRSVNMDFDLRFNPDGTIDVADFLSSKV